VLEIELIGETRIDSIGRRLRVATERKMLQLTEALYEKVIENVSGKILQIKSGSLVSSIHMTTDFSQELMTGSVYVEPADDKAWVLEKGGKGSYPIVATKAEVLHFFTKSGVEVFTKSVDHPPSRKFAYMQTALDDMRELVPQGFAQYIQAALNDEDFG
jgi:hypothetical protein